MKKPKKLVSMRLSEETCRELAQAAKMHGVSQADVVSVILHCWHNDIDPTEWSDFFDIARRA